tara:strand:- start:110 stop:2170 length:2061 start_codon:yes stop_codon:yes gene_type:complete
MIDTNKLIPQRKQSERLSGKTLVTIGLIKKDVVKIDSLLKEKLVLSKVRYGILRQQNERERRLNRERILESKKNRPQDYDADLKSDKKRKGIGGFLGGILKAVLAGLGFTIFKSLPALLKIGKIIKTIATPFIIGATVFIAAIGRIADAGSKVVPQVRGKDFRGASEKSITDGINGLSRALIETAVAFLGGAIAGSAVSRIVGGKRFNLAQAKEVGARKAYEDAARLSKQRNIKKRITTTGLDESDFRRVLSPKDYILHKKANAGNELTSKERIRLSDLMDENPAYRDMVRRKTDLKFKKLEVSGAFQYDSRLTPGENILRLVDLEPPKSQRKKRLLNELSKNQIKARTGEIDAEQKIVDQFIENETIKKQKKLVDLAQVRIDRTAGRRKGVPIDFSDFAEVDIDEDELMRLDREMKGLKPKRVSAEAVVGDQSFMRAPTIPKKPKINAAKLASKKGLSKLLFKFGGEAFEQSVKQTIKASVGTVPILGDLIGFLLDIFLFGQPVGRAAFMASGSFIGSLIGGVFGLIGGPPGALVGSILGGIGGDILGGAFYDLLFEGGVVGRITDNLSQSFVKKGVKTGVGMGFMSGGYAPFGGIVHAGEFVIDADSTRAIERRSPGFLMALNKAKGSQVNEVLETYMSYGNEGEGSERLIPLPFEKVVTRTVVTNTGSKDDSSSPFMDLYRRG